MSHYRIQVPQDILSLLLSVLRKDPINRHLLITPTFIEAGSSIGCMCYTHNVEIDPLCSFVFPIDPSAKISSDLAIEWDVVIDDNGDIRIKNAKYIFSDATVAVSHASCSSEKSRQLPEFQPFPHSLASAIPVLSKFVPQLNSSDSYRYSSGIVFTERSTFATTGTQFVCWTDSPSINDNGQTNASIFTAYLDIHSRLETETKSALTAVYEECIQNPSKHLNTFEFDEYSAPSPEEWLESFKDYYPTVDEFIKRFAASSIKRGDEPPSYFSIFFPKYLENILTQDSCSYGFGFDYVHSLFNYNAFDVSTAIPSTISFFLSTTTYLGKKLQGPLVWHTTIDSGLSSKIGTYDSLLFGYFIDFDKKFHYNVPASVFSAFQSHIKRFTRLSSLNSSGVAFTNHHEELGIGNLLDHEIQSTPTSLPLPAGISNYVVIPSSFADIQVPPHVSSITLLFNESKLDLPVCVVVGNLLYFFARKDNIQNGERIPFPVKFLDTPLIIPATPKFGFAPATILKK